MFAMIAARGLHGGIGVAIGSLVPLRGRGKYVEMARIITGALRGIPEDRRDTVPIHVFGVSGDMIPLLAYLGVDSFDSSTYVQASRSLDYYHPAKRKMVHLLELDGLPCDCRICRAVDFAVMHDTLTARDGYRPQETGVYKSFYYAQVALHNHEMEQGLLSETREALRADDLVTLLVEHAAHFPRVQEALQSLATDDPILSPHVTRVRFDTRFLDRLRRNPMQPPLPSFPQPARPIVSLRFTPDDFRVPKAYAPPAGKDILLVVPCSETKPYAASRSHRALAKRLSVLGDETVRRIYKVTLSGLYGPVPVEYEEDESVLHYNFLLAPTDAGQIALCSQRLETYLERFGARYTAMFGYATSKAYRTVLKRVAKRVPSLCVYPTTLASQLPTEFYRHTHLDALLHAIRAAASEDEGRADERGYSSAAEGQDTGAAEARAAGRDALYHTSRDSPSARSR
jgi:predicted RNA-binding protein